MRKHVYDGAPAMYVAAAAIVGFAVAGLASTVIGEMVSRSFVGELRLRALARSVAWTSLLMFVAGSIVRNRAWARYVGFAWMCGYGLLGWISLSGVMRWGLEPSAGLNTHPLVLIPRALVWVMYLCSAIAIAAFVFPWAKDVWQQDAAS